MIIINSIIDLERLVDEWSGEGYWGDGPLVHRAAVKAVAQAIRDDAHEAGLRYGRDWSEFLRGIDLEQYVEAATG